MSPGSDGKEARPSSHDQMLSRLRKLTFKSTVSGTPKQIEQWAREFTADIRPGIGLVGSPELEAEYDRAGDVAKWKASREIRTDVVDQQSDNSKQRDVTDTLMEDAGSPSDEGGQIGGSDSGDSQNDMLDAEEPLVYSPGSDDIGVEFDNDEEYEELTFGDEFVEITPDKHILLYEYFGKHWIKMIHDLYDVPPMEKPSRMTLTPHAWQLKGASQADFCCRGPFRGYLCGDQVGLGKTLLAILAIWLRKDEPGFSVVVCPKSVMFQWSKMIERSWEDGYEMRAFVLEDSTTTAHQLHAGGHDIVLTSYEFLEANARPMNSLPGDLADYVNKPERTIMPERPISALHSTFWREINLPIKRLILDEAQRVNKRDGARHRALKDLYYEAVICLSGTLAHNRWHDLSGMVDFLQGHPFTTHRKFLHTFSTWDYDGQTLAPDARKTRLLQRFLQPFTVARPSKLLKLPDCKRYKVSFLLSEDEQAEVSKLTTKYVKAKLSADAEAQRRGSGIEGNDSSKAHLPLAIKAMLRSLHPLLLNTKPIIDGFVDIDEDDPDEEYLEHVAEAQEESHEEWLKRVQDREELCTESSRVVMFLQFFKWLREEFPTGKMAIFSGFAKFLDIIDESLKRTYGVKSLRYDGRVKERQRQIAQEQFNEGPPDAPLLITAGAGGVGLNLQAASIVIQLEVWWNRSTEIQAAGRAARQGNDNQVEVFRFEGRNSDICSHMAKAQKMKSNVIDELMEPMFRRHDEGPDIRELLETPALEPYQFSSNLNDDGTAPAAEGSVGSG